MRRVFTSDLSITRAERILRAARFGGRTRCPECGFTRKFWRLEDGRWRCKRCRKRFGLFTDTPLARESFEPLEILELLYWFELGLTDHGIAERLDVSYDRVHRFFLKLRRAIRDFEERSFRLLDGEVEVDETYFGASFENRRAGKRAKLRKAGKVKRGRGAKELQHVVFGIYERTDGIVYVDLVEDASGAELKAALRDNVSIETTVYSDTLSSYQGLDEEFAGHETISHRAGEYVRGPATINGIEGYWAYAKERLLRPHGMADKHFLLYLKETEYRFNHRHLDQEEFVNHLLEHVLLS
jgi:transposase-like protein